jgi:uncharacterized protein YjiS (DUF1127 family)
MTTTYAATGLRQTAVSTRPASSFIRACWAVFLERRERARLRAGLYDLNARELQDIGITQGEIEYVVSNSSVDPRGIRSGG